MVDQSVLEKAKNIRLLILDIDGVMTTGALYYDAQGSQMKGFHIHDGMGIKLLQKTGVMVAVISGKSSKAAETRMNDLGIKHVYLGYEDKLPIYNELKQLLGLEDHQIAHMGDDLPDLPLLIRVGLAISVPKAPKLVHQHVDFITKTKPGKGAVREACEMIMEAQNSFESVVQSYLIK